MSVETQFGDTISRKRKKEVIIMKDEKKIYILRCLARNIKEKQFDTCCLCSNHIICKRIFRELK